MDQQIIEQIAGLLRLPICTGHSMVAGLDLQVVHAARTLGHPFLDQWRGREHELAADAGAGARQAYQDAVARGELPPLPVWASEAVDLINDLPPAAGLVGALAAQAEQALARAIGR